MIYNKINSFFEKISGNYKHKFFEWFTLCLNITTINDKI